jgi:hypothetical protein
MDLRLLWALLRSRWFTASGSGTIVKFVLQPTVVIDSTTTTGTLVTAMGRA